MKRSEHGMGTVRTVRERETGKVVGYQALLPRDLSEPPVGRKVSADYREPLGGLQATREDARRLLDAAIVELREKRTLRHGITFAIHADNEIQARLQDARRKYKNEAMANKQVATFKSIVKCWLSDAPWFDFPIHVIERDDLQTTFNHLRDEAESSKGEPLTGHFIHNVARFVRAVFDRAGIVPSPAERLNLPPKGEKDVRYLDLEAQVRLFSSQQLELEDRVMVGCGMGTGLRVGELLAIEPADVHLNADDPHVIVRYGGPHRAPTKGKRARRVELFEPGLGFWRIWMERFFRRGSRLVFAGPEGGYRKHWPENFPRWAPVARIDRLSSHIMRHTYAVSMLSGTWGYDPKSMEFASNQLGHADIQTTQRYYAAFESGTWQREVRRMTGRTAEPAARRHVVTAAWLLGLGAGASNGASISGSSIKKAENDAHWFNSPQSPKSPQVSEIPGIGQRAGAATHQRIVEHARRVLELADAGDGQAFEAADALAASLAAAGESIQTAGLFRLTRAIHIARVVLGYEPASREAASTEEVGHGR